MRANHNKHRVNAPVEQIIGASASPLRGTVFLLLFVALALLVWEYASVQEFISEFNSRPSEVAKNLWVIILDRSYDNAFQKHMWASMKRVATGLVVGSMIGFPLGSFLALYPNLRFCAVVLVPLATSFSRIAMLFLIVLWFGIGHEIKYIACILVTFQTQLFVSFQSSYVLLLGKDGQSYDWMGRAAIIGMTRWQLYWKVLFPMLLPRFFFGLLAASISCWGLLPLVEAINRSFGIGAVVSLANDNAILKEVVSGAILLALGSLCYWMIIWLIQRRVLRWNR